MATQTLKEFIQKNREIANQNIRCGSCNNVLVHCGKYEIGVSENGFESLICETCKNNLRVPKKATKIDNNGNVINFVIPVIQQNEKTSKEDPREKFKQINRPEDANKVIVKKSQIQQQAQQQQNQNVDKEEKENKKVE